MSQSLYRIIRAPITTEKTTRATESSNQYVFEVKKNTTKQQVKQAVESLFKVTVVSVTTINCLGKVKRNRMGAAKLGKRSDWKKAYVRVSDGQTIDVFDTTL